MFRQSVSERVKRLGERLGIAPFRPRVLLKSTLIVSASAVFACIALLGIMYLLYAWKLKPPDQAIAETMGTSAAFDRTGQNELYQYTDPFGGLRHPVPLDQMSPYLVAAT